MKNILSNLFIAYSLGSKDQFIEAISKYADQNEIDDEGMKQLIEQVFFEINILSRKRQAKQEEEVIDLENKVKSKSDEPSEQKIDLLLEEIRSLKTEISAIKSQINNS